MDFFYIIISILRWFPPGKWVPLGKTVEGGSKHLELFIGIQWPPLCILLINAAIISDTALSEYVVFRREGGGVFTRAHPSLQVYDVLYAHQGAEKVYL